MKGLQEVGIEVLFFVYIDRGGAHIPGIFKEDVQYPVVKMATAPHKINNTTILHEMFLILGSDDKYHYVDSNFCKLAKEDV